MDSSLTFSGLDHGSCSAKGQKYRDATRLVVMYEEEDVFALRVRPDIYRG